MKQLETLLGQVASVYADLVDASLPGRSGEPSDSAPDPLCKPAPGNLSVMDHRHKLVRGLRWWVDAVQDSSGARVGESVPAMVRVIHAHLPVMADEDRAELARNLGDWLHAAWPYLGDPGAPVQLDLPAEAYLQRVRVADAAAILGCTVRTIQRRVPADRRQGGMVVLGEAADRCEHCELIVGQCAHTRAHCAQ